MADALDAESNNYWFGVIKDRQHLCLQILCPHPILLWLMRGYFIGQHHKKGRDALGLWPLAKEFLAPLLVWMPINVIDSVKQKFIARLPLFESHCILYFVSKGC